jgi:hypothetical protein
MCGNTKYIPVSIDKTRKIRKIYHEETDDCGFNFKMVVSEYK